MAWCSRGRRSSRGGDELDPIGEGQPLGQLTQRGQAGALAHQPEFGLGVGRGDQMKGRKQGIMVFIRHQPADAQHPGGAWGRYGGRLEKLRIHPVEDGGEAGGRDPVTRG